MEFTEFAQILKLIIGGSYSTHVFARTLFETIITEDGVLQIEDISDNTFKAYYNGKTKTTMMVYMESTTSIDSYRKAIPILLFNGTFSSIKSETLYSSSIRIGSSMSYTII